MTRLTYSDGLTHQSQALAHLGALEALLPLYAGAWMRHPAQYEAAPSPLQFRLALDTVRAGVRAMSTEDFRETTP